MVDVRVDRTGRGSWFWLALILASWLVTVNASAAPGPSVTLDAGVILGSESRGVVAFKGIPYAEPPVGALRWRAPIPARAWKDPRSALEFGNACPQPSVGGRAQRFGDSDDDCLTLNVWAPKEARGAPVMVWVHGGAFRIGRGGTELYDGTRFAEDGVVLVSINYRLGELGFFALPALTAEAGDEATGNFGLMDQRVALQWVQTNIARFGGDPDNVTIFGESAGGASVLNLMAMPSARGLFHKAIAQSGGGVQRRLTLAEVEQANTALVAKLQLSGTDVLSALRALPGDALLQQIASARGPMTLGFGPMIDGKLIPKDVTRVFMAGEQAPVPLLIGANSYEASVLAAFGSRPEQLLDALGPAKARVLELYAGETSDPALVAAKVFGDRSFVAPAREIAAWHSGRDQRAFLYHLSYVRDGARLPGAAHGADVPLVFDTLSKVPGARLLLGRKDFAMATTMHAYWVNFAKHGDPGTVNGVRWPAYHSRDDMLLEFGKDQVAPREQFRKPVLDAVMLLARMQLGLGVE